MLFINWMKSYRYRREINRHWSVSTHLYTDQKTIRDNLRRTGFDWWFILLNLNRSFLLVMKSEIIFRDFSYIWLRFLSLSVYFRCSAVRERIDDKRSSLLNLVSIKFVSLRSQSNLDSRILLDLRILRKRWNSYNDVRFWITRRTIKRRTTNHNHKQKERRSEERISDAKNNNLKKT
jgi:hypothetical protein